METKSKFDGLVVKTNSHKNVLDCCYCCVNEDLCLECPLKDGYYFVNSSDNAKAPSSVCMSDEDKSKVDEIIRDLSWLSDTLRKSRNIDCVFDTTISMAKSYLELQLQRLSYIKSFDV